MRNATRHTAPSVPKVAPIQTFELDEGFAVAADRSAARPHESATPLLWELGGVTPVRTMIVPLVEPEGNADESVGEPDEATNDEPEEESDAAAKDEPVGESVVVTDESVEEPE